MTTDPGAPAPGKDIDGTDAQEASTYRRRWFARYPAESLLWLAAGPQWPLPLALECGFPTGSTPLPELVRQLAGAGLVDSREGIDDAGDMTITFELASSQRLEIGGYLRQAMAGSTLLSEVDKLSVALVSATDAAPGRWPQVEIWQLARRVSHDPSGAALNAAVDERINDGRSREALDLVAIAQGLGDVLGEPLASAARRATWRLDHAYRQAVDLQLLEDYVPRDELEPVLERLLDGDLPVLHLLGQGGVGKTMVVRSLASGEFAQRRERAAPTVARIDFDYLDPRYPETRPAELLLALAGELTGSISTREQLKEWRRFNDATTTLHENLAAASGTRPTSSAEQDLLHHAIDAFTDLLSELDGTVLLILDTCEELAKLHAPGAPAPALERTFEILERITARTSSVRVLLAGRRPLVATDEEQRLGDVLLGRRDYVTVVPLGGFTVEEAQQYIATRDADGRVPSALREAIVVRCLHAGEVNPFDLASYLDWAIEEPTLEPRLVRGKRGDPYVEQRVLGRLGDPSVRGALPVAVHLGRFDQAMIADALDRRGVDADAAFSGLAGQEWVSAVSFFPDGRPRVIEIDEHLRARIRAVLDTDPTYAVDRQLLGADLHRLITNRPTTDLTIETVEAALRLLSPAQAGKFWADFEVGIATADAWGWAAQVLPRVAAVEAALAESRPETVMAAILATQAAAVSRLPSRPGARRLWNDVSGLASRHPDPDEQRRLQFRAACGRLACAAQGLRAPLGEEPTLRRDVDEVLGWSDGVAELPWAAIAALDGLTAGGFALPADLSDLTNQLCDHPDRTVSASALLARATGQLAARRAADAATDVELALRQLARAATPAADPPVDWMPPRRLLDRARLARVCCARLSGERPQRSWAQWRREALEHLDDIDSERLVAALFELDADWSAPDPHVATLAAGRETYVSGCRPTHHWHRRTTPLRPALARIFGELGTVGPAIESLLERRAAAVAAGDDPDTIAACETVVIDLCRTFRTTEFSESVTRLAREGTPEQRSDAHAVLALVQGQSAKDPEQGGGWHAWWRTQVLAGQSTMALQRWRYADLGEGSDADVAELLDGLEADRLFGTARAVAEPRRADLVRLWILVLVNERRVITEGLSLGVGAALRANALLTIPEVTSAVDDWPPRLVARAALAEGELLALRLPDPACALLRLAVVKFDLAGDEVPADRARILLALAGARAEAGDPVEPVDFRLPRYSPSRLGTAWDSRIQLAAAVTSGIPLPPLTDPSPEVQLVLTHAGRRFDAGSSVVTSDVGAMQSAPGPTPSVRPPDVGTDAAPPPDARSPSRRRLVPALFVVLAAFAAIAVALLLTIRFDAGPDGSVATPAPTGTGVLPTPTASVTGGPTPSEGGTSGTDEPTTPSATPSEVPRPASDAIQIGPWVLTSSLLAALILGGGGWWLVARQRRDAVSRRHSRGHELAAYAQETVAAYVSSTHGAWKACRLTISHDELRIKPQGDLPLDRVEHGDLAASAPLGAALGREGVRSARPYVVVPVIMLGPDIEDARMRRLAVPPLDFGGKSELVLLVDGLQPPPGATIVPAIRVAWRTQQRLVRGLPYAELAYAGPLHLLPADEGPLTWQRGVRCGFLHLIGEPVSTATAGWRLRTRGGVSNQAQHASSKRTYADEELVGPDDVGLSGPSVVLLQADPVDGPSQPLGALRNGMLGLALGLRDAGVDWVIVVPPLPDRLAAEVVQKAAQTFAAGATEPSHPGWILDLVHDLRRLVAVSLDSPGDRSTIADDVMLLCRAT
jgi:AAA ATPase domain